MVVKNGNPTRGWSAGATPLPLSDKEIHTARARELRLQESEEKYRLLFERSDDAIFIIDSDTGRYLEANRAAELLTGRSIDELRNLRTLDVTPKGAKDRLRKLKDIKSSTSMEEVEYVRPDGSVRTALVDVVPLRDNLFFGIARDITERKQVEDSLKESEKRFRALFEQAGDYILLLEEMGKSQTEIKTAIAGLMAECGARDP